MTKSFSFMEKLEELNKALNSMRSYEAKFKSTTAKKHSMRSLVVQNFDNYEETTDSKTDIDFGTPAQRLAYQRVSSNHSSKRF